MANAKQAGANLTNTEFYTGRCRIQCEQCFVNFGVVGSGTLSGMMHPAIAQSNKAWIAYAKAHGWRHRNLGTFRLKPGDKGFKEYEGLEFPVLDQDAAWDIPRMPDPVSFMGSRKRPEKYPKLRGSMRYMLRVCSMSDSSTSPIDWCRAVLKAWGDYCFFNTSIKGALSSEEHFREVYHKVVITVNGGFQQVPDVPQYGTKPGVDERDVLGSMGDRDIGDFLYPVTLVTANDPRFAQYEGAVKWYRLRALPTIAPHFEPGPPFVVTQMRFKSTAHLLEFARKYDCGVNVFCSKSDKKTQRVFELFRPHLRAAKIDVSYQGDGTLARPNVLVEIWNNGRDNGSPHRGKKTVLRMEHGYYKAAGEDYAHYDYVCDRLHGSCVACGLCASLDGTQPGDVNALNVMKFANGREMVIGPESARRGYLWDEVVGETSYYAALLEQAAEHGMTQNPGRGALDGITKLAREVAKYVDQGRGEEINDAWNTHEDALALAAYCVFLTLREARHEGLGRDDAISAMYEFLLGATDGVDITAAVGDPEAIWDGTSPWNDEFGLL